MVATRWRIAVTVAAVAAVAAANAAFLIPAPAANGRRSAPRPPRRRRRPPPSPTIASPPPLPPRGPAPLASASEGSRDNEGDEGPGGRPSTVGVREGKAELLRAVSGGDRMTILRAARDLEALALALPSARPDPDGVGGRWSLVFSTQTDPVAGMDGSEGDGVIDAINAALYRFFFRFAPFLAGAQERRRGRSGEDAGGGASRSGGGGGGGGGGGLPGVTVSNEQLVDLATSGVDNRVTLRLGGGGSGPTVKVRVVGDLTGADPLDLGVTFTKFSVRIPPGPTVELPLPRPVGRLRTTYCDDDLRLSRGGRGGLFVLKRVTVSKQG